MKMKIQLVAIMAFGVSLTMLPVAGQSAGSAKGGAAKLVGAPNVTPAPATLSSRAMKSCPQCKDVTLTRRQHDSKGGGKALGSADGATETVVKHLCGACDTQWVVKGHGKAKQTVAVHKCASCL